MPHAYAARLKLLNKCMRVWLSWISKQTRTRTDVEPRAVYLSLVAAFSRDVAFGTPPNAQQYNTLSNSTRNNSCSTLKGAVIIFYLLTHGLFQNNRDKMWLKVDKAMACHIWFGAKCSGVMESRNESNAHAMQASINLMANKIIEAERASDFWALSGVQKWRARTCQIHRAAI